MAAEPRFSNALRYVREKRNLSTESVASELKVSEQKIKSFEDGTAVPTVKQYEALESIYGVSDFILAGERRPEIDDLLVDLRQAEATPLEISPKGLKALFLAISRVEMIDDIAEALQINPTKRRPKGLSIENISAMSQQVAALLDFDATDPKWIDEPDGALRYLRAQIEEYGVYCLLTEAPATDFRGLFTKLSHRASLILINKKTFKPKARLFTLVHEFAHFLTKVEGVSDPSKINNFVERQCNIFASRFLLPDARLKELYAQAGGKKKSTDRLVAYIANRSLLSHGASAYRLKEDGIISSADYKQWFSENGFSPSAGAFEVVDDNEDEPGPDQGNYAYNVASDFGFRPIQILKKAKDQSAIDDVHVAKIINARGTTQDTVFRTVANRLRKLGL